MCPCCAHVTCSSWLNHWIQGPPLSHTLWNSAQHFSLTVKLQLAHSGSSVVTCPFPAYSDPWDIFVATCSLRRCSLSGEILVPTSERLREGKREERKDPSLYLYRRFQWPPSPRIDWPLVTCTPPPPPSPPLPSPSQWILGSSDLCIQWLPWLGGSCHGKRFKGVTFWLDSSQDTSIFGLDRTFNDIDNIVVSSNNTKQSSVILQLDWPDADQKISPLAMNTLWLQKMSYDSMMVVDTGTLRLRGVTESWSLKSINPRIQWLWVRGSLGIRPLKNRKEGSGTTAGVEVYTAPGMKAHFRLAFD